METAYIEVHNLSKTYSAKNGNVEALKSVSLSIPKNEIFGVIGLSGAGKSTLVRCLNLLERPDSGEVIIDGQNLLTLSKEQLRLRRQKIGMIFQHFNLLKDIYDTMGITIVIITHEMRVIQEICTQVAVLDGGTVQECGSVAEIFKNPKSGAARRLLLMRETEEMTDVG